MPKSLQQFIYLMPVFQGLMWGLICLLTPKVFANPTPIIPLPSSESWVLDEREVGNFSSELSTFERLPQTDQILVSEGEKLTSNCQISTPLQRENTDNWPSPTSSCAEDLKGVYSVSESAKLTTNSTAVKTETLITQENIPDSIPESPNKTPSLTTGFNNNEETQSTYRDDEWHFTFQPYATIPVTAYGTATARGRTVSYSQSLGELLYNLRMTASGRVEAWKGRWGFILDGYYVSLKGVNSVARTRSRVPNTINALNFLLSKDVNTKFQNIATMLDDDVEKLQKVQALRESDVVETLEQNLNNFKETVASDVESIRELEQKIQTLKETAASDVETIRELEQKLQNFKDTVAKDAEALREFEQKVETFKNTVAQDAEALREFEQKVESFKNTVGQDAQALQELQQKIQDFQEIVVREGERFRALDFNLQDVQVLNLDRQELKDLITLNNQDVERFPPQQEINAEIEQVVTRLDNLEQLEDNLISSRERLEGAREQIQELQDLRQDIITLNTQDIERLGTRQELEAKLQNIVTRIDNLEQLEQDLISSRERLEQASQQIQELRALQDSESLQKLDTEIQNAKAVLDQNIEDINKIKAFQENREVQQLTSNSETELRFDQGIYDIALSYNIGDLPMSRLPDQPSNQTFPRVWFQPIAGVRINDINIRIDETIDLKLSSSLINFEGTFQETFQQGRTWFDPLIGGKLGIQVSNPLIIWVRGDYAGFDLAGETDYSWNVLFGVDWWVRRRLSLQLAYRFYEINYRVGNGNNAYGFSQNLNGPFVSATFHF
ncbi:Chromosome segregation ATPase-like protein [Gloeothece citriformis PCC 7424]|uniref:Chromosome segregation ATPase-like protein n=1 Tax=Gloeothece citriformis (strain PCC 7424) TaxID=65393 RepID=B7KJC5_GLOC7|nr:chromosome segregation ATPase [Gloeothece citriformis]ACK72209.1 Chromosome segregation ATPase-like protein [Gloeothece citriformis PCC 7424]